MNICQEKLRLLRKLWLEIQRDINDKKSTIEIEKLVFDMNQHSSHVQHQNEAAIKSLRYLMTMTVWKTASFTSWS